MNVPMGQVCMYGNCMENAVYEDDGMYYCKSHIKVDVLIIEMFPTPCLILDEDGNAKRFDSIITAIEELRECQDGYILDFKTMKIVR